MNHFDKLYCPESFAKIINDEYKRFLAIKCVEVIASCKNLEDTASIWLLSAQPRKLVELFWHADCLSTRKCCSDCNVIFGQEVEFTGPYDTHGVAPSTLEKHKILFQFERQFLKSSFPHYCGVPHTKDCKWADWLLRNKLFVQKLIWTPLAIPSQSLTKVTAREKGPSLGILLDQLLWCGE
jgi:hypothetical protein